MNLRFFIACCLFPCCLFAQKYNFVNWTVEDGLLQSQASCFAQDKFRQLWIGTQGGVSVFDGKKFRAYTVQDGLPSNNINMLFCDKEGKMWLGTDNGLTVFNGNKFHTITPVDSSLNSVNTMIAMKNGELLALCNNFAYLINGTQPRKINISGDTTERVTTLFRSGNDPIAFVYTKGFYRNEGNTWRLFYPTSGISPSFIARQLFVTFSGDTIISSNHGVYHFKKQKMHLYKVAGKNICDLNVFVIAEDARKNIWFGTDHGVYKLEGDELYHFDEKSGFTDNTVYDIFRDVENNMWFATNGDGIYKFRENTFTYYDRSSGLQNPIVMGVTQTSDGTIYSGGYGGGLYRIGLKGNIERVTHNTQGLDNSRINGLYADDENNIWIGTVSHGIWIYNAKTGARKLTAQNSTDEQPSSGLVFLKDKRGNLLIGTGQGLFMKDTLGNVKRVRTGRPLITALKQFDDEHVLVGSSNGLVLLDKNYKYSLFNEKEFGQASVLCLAKKKDNIWLGTTDHGVINYNHKTGKIIRYNTSVGLPSNFIYSIDVSDEQEAWIGTGFGISNIQVDKEGNLIAIKNYGRSDGLLGMECNHNSILRARDSSLWFGTTKGLFHFHPNTDISEKNQPFVLLRSVKLFSSDILDSTLFKNPGTWFPVPEGLKLSSRQNHITFELGSIYFTNPEDVLYKYKLEGTDKEFTTTTNPYIIYPSLPPGIYTLKVTGLTKNGTLSANTIYYTFEIEKAFYQTRFFQVFVILLLLGTGALIAYVFTRRRQRQKQKQKELLEKIREEEFMKLRQRTAEDFHDEMGNRLTRISVLTDVLKSKINGTEQEVTKLVEQIKENTASLYHGSRDIIWSLNSRNDGMYEIAEHIKDIGNELFQETQVDFSYYHNIGQYNTLKLKLDYSRNLTMIFKEAYSNILKHSGATRVEVIMDLQSENELVMRIRDNGKGFELNAASGGNGIKNMQNRVNRLNGELTMTSALGSGTEIYILLKNIFT